MEYPRFAFVMEKNCTKCNEVKSLDLFWKRGLKHSSSCKSCNNSHIAKYRAEKRKNPAFNKKKNELKKALVERNKEFVSHYLSKNPCIDCGESDTVVLEFDHIRDKVRDVSVMVHNGFSLDNIKAEIAKCQVRCANCHRRVTAYRRVERVRG